MSGCKYPTEWPAIAETVKELAGWKCTCCHVPNDDNAATGDHLTVHHRDGNPLNCAPENLVALCQRCHLRSQARLIKYGPEDRRQLRMTL
jgi:5-methylcytosine-specific restriction endonuclease McrA